jgi:hypothetical protein
MLVRTLLTLTLLFGSVGLYACGDDDEGDCISRCEEAQSKSCTSIKNCKQTCEDGVRLGNAAGCSSQTDAYINCLNSGDVCTTDARCQAQSNAYGTCVVTYCLANPSNADCQTLIP